MLYTNKLDTEYQNWRRNF